MFGNSARAAAAICLVLSGFLNLASGATATHRVRMYYNLGVVDIDLYGNESPLHVAHFLEFVNAGDFDNTYIHRTRSGSFLFDQGGEFYVPGPNDYLDENTVLERGPVVNEFDPNNGLSNTPGTLAAARTADPDSADNGWFINSTDNSIAFDPGPYTVYGQVTSGLSVIQYIPTLPNVQQFQGTIFATLPVYQNWLVILDQAIELSLIDGDFDKNGQVGSGDLAIWAETYGTWNEQLADLNGDLRVDGADYQVWEAGYGHYNGFTTLAHFEDGDADHDWDVDGMDFLKLQRTTGKTKSAAADANGDAVVSALDFLTWQRNVGANILPAIGTVPEPSSLALLSLGVLILSGRRR